MKTSKLRKYAMNTWLTECAVYQPTSDTTFLIKVRPQAVNNLEGSKA